MFRFSMIAFVLFACAGCNIPNHEVKVIHDPVSNNGKYEISRYNSDYNPTFWVIRNRETGEEVLAVHECGVARIKRDDE